MIALTSVGAVLVATHEGEFWPFSIYPMFSQAGRPWERVIVRDISGVDGARIWQETTLENLPGRPFPVALHDIPQNDLAKYVKLTREWSQDRVAGLHALFAESLTDPQEKKALVIYRVRGNVDRATAAATIRATPLVLLSTEADALNPQLVSEETLSASEETAHSRSP